MIVILHPNLIGVVSVQVCNTAQSAKPVWERHLIQLLLFIPKIVSHGASYWTSRLLRVRHMILRILNNDCLVLEAIDWIILFTSLMQAFTRTFRESKPGSLLKLACISAIEDMLTPVSLASLLSRIITLSSILTDNPMKTIFPLCQFNAFSIMVQIIDPK